MSIGSPAKVNSAKRPRRGVLALLLLGAAATALAVAAAAWHFKDRWLPAKDGVRPGVANEVPAAALADYTPEDTAAVLVVNVSELRRTPGLGERLPALLAPWVGEGLLPRRLGLVGVDLLRDTDVVTLLVTDSDRAHPLLLLRGRFDAARFQVAPGRLREVTEETPAGRFRLYEDADGAKAAPGYFAAVGTEYLLFSESKAQVVAALAGAAEGRKPLPRDSGLRDALERLDRRQAVWGAAALDRLRPMPRLQRGIADSAIRPVLDQAVRIEGGLDVSGKLTLHARLDAANPDEAETLAERAADLTKQCWIALEALTPGTDYPKGAEPLLRLLAGAKVERDGSSVTLRSSIDPR
jgi:hypothetical protein